MEDFIFRHKHLTILVISTLCSLICYLLALVTGVSATTAENTAAACFSIVVFYSLFSWRDI